jgi:F-type H+-transporting ATPase subunit a
MSTENPSHAAEGHSPLAQFEIKTLLNIEFLGYDLSLTNSAFFMLLATIVGAGFMLFATRRHLLIPNRLQASAEYLYEFVLNMLKENTGEGGRKFFPFIFSIFIFVLLANLLGMLPYSFTSTSHIVMTFALATMLFIVIIVAAFMQHGLKFFTIFMPPGAPLWMAPLLITIELFAYLARPISLSIRLAANMTAGHTMMKVIAGFIVSMGITGGWLPFGFLVVLNGFEIFVAILQAYIFTMLACVYLDDAVHLAH